MFGVDKRYLSICIQDTTIKISQVKSSGSVEKVALGLSPSTSADDLAKTVKGLLSGFDKKASVICVVPANAATSKSIEVPSSDPKEIYSIINLQASRHTPYSREEVLIGYINLGSSSGNTKILLVIAHRNIVKDRLAILEKCGLNIEKFLFAPEGIGRLYAKGLSLKPNSPPVGIIDINAQSTSFIVAARGAVVFARSIPIGIKQIASGSESALIDEISKSLEAYQSEEGQPVSSFVVTSDHSSVKNLMAALQEVLKVQVSISPYMNMVKANAVKGKLTKDFADESFLDTIAPALFVVKSEVNLIPEEITVKRTVEHQSKEAVKAFGAIVIIMALLCTLVWSKMYFKDAYLNQKLRSDFSSQKEEVKKLQERMSKTKLIRDYMVGRMNGLEVLKEVYAITPKEIYLNTVAFDEDKTVTLSGISQSMSQVFSFVKALDDSLMFEDAKTKSTSTKKEGDKDVAAFEVTFKLTQGQGQ